MRRVPHWRERKKYFWCIFDDLSKSNCVNDCLSLQISELFDVLPPYYCAYGNSWCSKLCTHCKELKEGKEKGVNFFSFFVKIKSPLSWRNFNENHRCHWDYLKQSWCRHLKTKYTIYCVNCENSVRKKKTITAGMFYTALLCLRGISKDVIKYHIIPSLLSR